MLLTASAQVAWVRAYNAQCAEKLLPICQDEAVADWIRRQVAQSDLL